MDAYFRSWCTWADNLEDWLTLDWMSIRDSGYWCYRICKLFQYSWCWNACCVNECNEKKDYQHNPDIDYQFLNTFVSFLWWLHTRNLLACFTLFNRKNCCQVNCTWRMRIAMDHQFMSACKLVTWASDSTASFFEMLCRVLHEKRQLEIIAMIQTDPSNSFSFNSKSQTLAIDTNLFMVLMLWRFPLSTVWQLLVSEIL